MWVGGKIWAWKFDGCVWLLFWSLFYGFWMKNVKSSDGTVCLVCQSGSFRTYMKKKLHG